MKARTSAAAILHVLKNGTRIQIERGLPDLEALHSAWKDEPLTSIALKNVDLAYALAPPNPELSYIVTSIPNIQVAQCAANRAVDFWAHTKALTTDNVNKNTKTFIEITRFAAKWEERFLKEVMNEDGKRSLHNAGLAIVPELRGLQVGELLGMKQVEIAKTRRYNFIVLEATNKHSAKIAGDLGARCIKSWSYSSLAFMFHNPDLAKLDDAYSVWFKKI